MNQPNGCSNIRPSPRIKHFCDLLRCYISSRINQLHQAQAIVHWYQRKIVNYEGVKHVTKYLYYNSPALVESVCQDILLISPLWSWQLLWTLPWIPAWLSLVFSCHLMPIHSYHFTHKLKVCSDCLLITPFLFPPLCMPETGHGGWVQLIVLPKVVAQ